MMKERKSKEASGSSMGALELIVDESLPVLETALGVVLAVAVLVPILTLLALLVVFRLTGEMEVEGAAEAVVEEVAEEADDDEEVLFSFSVIFSLGVPSGDVDDILMQGFGPWLEANVYLLAVGDCCCFCGAVKVDCFREK